MVIKLVLTVLFSGGSGHYFLQFLIAHVIQIFSLISAIALVDILIIFELIDMMILSFSGRASTVTEHLSSGIVDGSERLDFLRLAILGVNR